VTETKGGVRIGTALVSAGVGIWKESARSGRPDLGSMGISQIVARCLPGPWL